MSIFLHIPGITGESSDPNHQGWIDVRNFSWGVGRDINSHTSTQGDRESSNATISDLTLKKFMDKSTAQLFIESCCGGGKTIKFHLSKTGQGSGADSFIEYTLHNALVSDYKVAAFNDDTDRPIEKVKISFVKLEIRYIPYDEDGNAEAALAVAFDTAKNMKA